MNHIEVALKKTLGLALVLALSLAVAFAQQTTGSVRGQVTDELGGTLVGATVTLVNEAGAEKTAMTNEEGIYVFNGVAPGKYTVRVVQSGFGTYENTDVNIGAGRREQLDIKMSVTIAEEKVTVSDDRSMSTESDANANAIVLRGKDLDVLPDDPDDLAQALTALAGPSAGPNGGQIYIDGFTGGRMPPKEAIREVRINQNPLNAENDQPGFGRIDIFTRPGFGKITGSASINFNDEAFNSRNPFAPTRTDFQQRLYSFTLSGPLSAKKASFFVDFQRRDVDDNDIINAQVLDAALNPVTFTQGIVQPRRFTTFSPRFDYALNQNHTLVARYTYTRSGVDNSNVGGFSLPSLATNLENSQHTFQITETAVLNPRWLNEARFQFIRSRNEQLGDNLVPTLTVSGAFTSGGSPIGEAFSNTNRWELQNYTTATLGAHVLRFGARLRGVRFSDFSNGNFNGAFLFSGGLAPQLDANNQIVRNANGDPVLIQISSLERYRRTILFQQQNLPFQQIVLRGGGPTQYSLAGGNPEASVTQFDIGAFVQDEWRLRPNFVVTGGLRYENQSNISSNFNFAPRLFFAWAPGGTSTGTMVPVPQGFGSNQPKFVIRGGVGLFYERFNEFGTLQANRFNGTNQLRFIVGGQDVNAQGQPVLANVLFGADGSVTGAPTVEQLSGLQLPQTTTQIAEDFRAPYSMLAALNVERQLPFNTTLWAVVFTFRTRHAPVLRNVNAPLPDSITALNPDGIRPDADGGDIYRYESIGIMNDIRFQTGFRSQLRPGVTLFGNYQTGLAKSTTDCIWGTVSGCFPANSYNVAAEYGRVAFFPRHRFILGGTIDVPMLKVSLNPFIIASTGQFYNITTGRDNNGDGIFTDRPAFVSNTTRPEDIRVTSLGTFDINPVAGAPIIPRNYGEGPGFFIVNLGISRTIGFGDLPGANAAAAGGGGGGPRGGGAPGGAAGGGGGRPGGGGGAAGPGGAGGVEKRFKFTFSLNIQNLFNRTNLCAPVGNLSSPFFGQSLSTTGPWGGCGFSGNNQSAGNRRIQMGVRFNF
jgi:hypothetical protein